MPPLQPGRRAALSVLCSSTSPAPSTTSPTPASSTDYADDGSGGDGPLAEQLPGGPVHCAGAPRVRTAAGSHCHGHPPAITSVADPLLFAPQKFALLHQHDPSLCRAFPRNQGCPGLGQPLALDSILVPPTNSATLLGFHLDQHLTFGPHLDCIDRCCARGLQALSALGGSRWGLSLHEND